MCLWLYSVPWVWLGILIVTIFVLVGLAGLSLARRLILPGLGHVAHQNEVTGAILHGILIIYGLAVALIAIAVWESYSDVTKVVSEEATAIASLYRDFSGYPEPTRTQLRDDLRAYTDQIIHGAWPIQRRGGTPTEGVVMMTSVQDRLFAFNPATEAQKILHAETLHAYNELILARRLRVDALGSGLPPAMWAVVLIGALITLWASYFFDVGSVRLQRIMVGLLASLMGLLVFLILVYDRPLVGTHGIGPEAYELIYTQLMKY